MSNMLLKTVAAYLVSVGLQQERNSAMSIGIKLQNLLKCLCTWELTKNMGIEHFPLLKTHPS